MATAPATTPPTQSTPVRSSAMGGKKEPQSAAAFIAAHQEIDKGAGATTPLGEKAQTLGRYFESSKLDKSFLEELKKQDANSVIIQTLIELQQRRESMAGKTPQEAQKIAQETGYAELQNTANRQLRDTLGIGKKQADNVGQTFKSDKDYVRDLNSGKSDTAKQAQALLDRWSQSDEGKEALKDKDSPSATDKLTAYQESKGLKVDGKLGIQTLSSLKFDEQKYQAQAKATDPKAVLENTNLAQAAKLNETKIGLTSALHKGLVITADNQVTNASKHTEAFLRQHLIAGMDKETADKTLKNIQEKHKVDLNDGKLDQKELAALDQNKDGKLDKSDIAGITRMGDVAIQKVMKVAETAKEAGTTGGEQTKQKAAKTPPVAQTSEQRSAANSTPRSL